MSTPPTPPPTDEFWERLYPRTAAAVSLGLGPSPEKRLEDVVALWQDTADGGVYDERLEQEETLLRKWIPFFEAHPELAESGWRWLYASFAGVPITPPPKPWGETAAQKIARLLAIPVDERSLEQTTELWLLQTAAPCFKKTAAGPEVDNVWQLLYAQSSLPNEPAVRGYHLPISPPVSYDPRPYVERLEDQYRAWVRDDGPARLLERHEEELHFQDLQRQRAAEATARLKAVQAWFAGGPRPDHIPGTAPVGKRSRCALL